MQTMAIVGLFAGFVALPRLQRFGQTWPVRCGLKIWLVGALWLSIAGAAGAAPASATPRRDHGAEFFSEPILRTFQIELSEAALAQLRQAPRSYVTGRVTEGNRVLTNVAIVSASCLRIFSARR